MDTQLLTEMREAIDSYRSSNMDVGTLADRLLTLRDGLRFKDDSWFHELTQQIATLDSASTFTPKNDKQTCQLSHAISTAVDTLLRLIADKLKHPLGSSGASPQNTN